MGQVSIKSHPLASRTSAQTVAVPSQTYELNSVYSIPSKNPPGGKKKRNKYKNSNTEKGIASTQNTQEGGTKEKRKIHFICTICGDDHPTHQCPWKDEVHIFLAQQQAPQHPIVLTHPFPPQPQNMVSTNLAPLQGGMECTPHHEGSSSNAYFFMCDHIINLQTQDKNYDIF
jgi:hypothetical protein